MSKSNQSNSENHYLTKRNKVNLIQSFLSRHQLLIKCSFMFLAQLGFHEISAQTYYSIENESIPPMVENEFYQEWSENSFSNSYDQNWNSYPTNNFSESETHSPSQSSYYYQNNSYYDKDFQHYPQQNYTNEYDNYSPPNFDETVSNRIINKVLEDSQNVSVHEISGLTESSHKGTPQSKDITWNPSYVNNFSSNDPGSPSSYSFDQDKQHQLNQTNNVASTAFKEELKLNNQTAQVNLNELAPKQTVTPPLILPTAPTQDNETLSTDSPLSNPLAVEQADTTENVGPINFNNVSMIEYIRFISRVTNKNFVFEEEDLQFNVTIISEKPTSIFNLMTALLQELKVRDLSLMEQGNSIIIHRNPRIRAPGSIVTANSPPLSERAQIITRVFRLNTLDPLKVTEIIKPLLSDDALVEVLRDSNNLIITDLLANVDKIDQLLKSLDAPNSGVTVGQYVVRNGFVDSIVELATKIMMPIAQGNPFVLVPHASSNSVYIVSNPFIVDKALAVLQNLDQNDGKTKVFSMDNLRHDPNASSQSSQGPNGQNNGPDSNAGSISAGSGQRNASQEEEFYPGTIGRGSSVFNETSEFLPGGISAASRLAKDLPAGHIARTVFFIYKLKYRRGDQIETSIRKIAISLMSTGLSNVDLVSAINSVQWIESSNSLIFTGTAHALEKIKDLIVEIDTPLNQVYIEMLILDTTLEDSLAYGVDWGLLFGGGNTAGGESFNPGVNQSVLPTLQPNVNSIPNAKPLLSGQGFNLGIIGRHLTHNGMHFSTISALVRALHRSDKAQIVLNPRILTEDNVTAEIFVGETDRYKTQSISNDEGDVITNNFQFIDVGTTLRVTPLIGNNGIITLDIIEEVTSPAPTANTLSDLPSNTDVNLVPVLFKNRSTTRIHIPNGFFVIMSGLISANTSTYKNEIPCLGMIPILGGAGKYKRNNDRKRNLMIFIRPVIVNTECELEEITKRQQDVYRDKSRSLRAWNYEIDEALDFFNIKSRDPDEIGCQLK